MKIIITLIHTILSVAAPPKATPKAPSAPLWTRAFPGEHPTAAYFDATSGTLFVSLRDPNGEGGRIAQVSLDGKVEKPTVARSKGPPGPLRSYGDRLYWISGQGVQSFGPN